jgi:hypothetical protein
VLVVPHNGAENVERARALVGDRVLLLVLYVGHLDSLVKIGTS